MSNVDDLILLDCDEVLADCANPMLDEIYELVGTRYEKEDMKQWDILDSFDLGWLREEFERKISRKGFCESFDVLEGAKEGYELLKKTNKTIVIVTAPMNTPYWVCERNKWLKKYFDISEDRIIHTRCKHFISAKCLIDDKVENVVNWKSRNKNGLAALWEAPYNKDFHDKNIKNFSSWEKLVTELLTK